MLLAACATGSSATAPPSRVAFATTLKTTDNQFVVQCSVTPNRQDLNLFTVEVQDAATRKPAPRMQVQLSAIMLDMDMGTNQIDLPPDGHGLYSAQGTLSMSGHWEIRIVLRTPDAALHQATVKLDTQVQ